MEPLNRPLTPEELQERKRAKALQRAENELDMQWKERAELPSAWFGRLLAIAVVGFCLDTVGWVAAFLSPRLSYYLSLTLKASSTISIIGMALLAIWGLVEGYRHEQVKKRLRETFRYTEDPISPHD